MKRLLAPAIAVLIFVILATFLFELNEKENTTPSPVKPNPASTRYSDTKNPFNSNGGYKSKIKDDGGLKSAISQGDDADFVSGGDAALASPEPSAS
jgi:hypothetical protein